MSQGVSGKWPKQDNSFMHKEFPKQFSKDDFWSQIKRTVDGKPVSEMIST
jgi:hypothetical protein